MARNLLRTKPEDFEDAPLGSMEQVRTAAQESFDLRYLATKKGCAQNLEAFAEGGTMWDVARDQSSKDLVLVEVDGCRVRS